MIQVIGYQVKLDMNKGGFTIVPLPWERLVFPRIFPTEAEAQKAVSILERAREIGQNFIPVKCDDGVVRLYYILSNFCPKQFLFPDLTVVNNFKSVSEAMAYYQAHKDQMVFGGNA